MADCRNGYSTSLISHEERTGKALRRLEKAFYQYEEFNPLGPEMESKALWRLKTDIRPQGCAESPSRTATLGSLDRMAFRRTPSAGRNSTATSILQEERRKPTLSDQRPTRASKMRSGAECPTVL